MNISLKNSILILLLAVVFLVPFFSMQTFSPAFDEVTHLPSGYTYLKTGDIKLNPQHPPLIKILAAFPLLFLDLKFDPNDKNLAGDKFDEWTFGRSFIFENGADRLIFWGRLPIILLAVLLGFYIYKWAKELYGFKAGVISLFIYALMPNIIAHSHFVTTDLGLSAFSFIALYYLWKFTKSHSKRDMLISGAVFGLALASKFLAVFLVPVISIMLGFYVHNKYRDSVFLFKFNSFLKIIIPVFVITFLVVWSLYFFPKDPMFYWDGLSTVYADENPEYYYYLNGNFDRDGWWYYFLWAFIIKTPIPFLILLFWALLRYGRSGWDLKDSLFIFLPSTLFLAVASWKGHNIGVRYILPIYPFLILYAGCFASQLLEKAKLKIAVLILALWYAFGSLMAYPNYLAYFNELVGGSVNGYKYLDDSNIEWGHDWKRLAEYQKNNPGLKVFLWTDAQTYKFYGIDNVLSLGNKEEWLNPKGKYAVSVHIAARGRLMAQVYKDKSFGWVDSYQPIDRIGTSFLVYEFK